MKKLFAGIRSAFLAVALVGLGSAAQAVVITDSTAYNFSWSFNTGTSLLTGTGSMTVSGFNSSSLTVAVTLTNTSSLGGTGGERLTSFGFGINPNATGVTFSDAADAGMIGASLSSIPSLATVEICAYGGPNCSGGSNGGIFGAGGSDSFSLILAGNWDTSVNIDPIGFKYQTGYGSFEFTTTTTSTTTTGGGTTTSSTSGNVPEPSTGMLALLGLGLLGAGFGLRRKSLPGA